MQIRYTIGTKARARGVEPRGAVLEAAGSPRSTLVGIKRGIRRESNPCLLVHSQACRNRYTTDTTAKMSKVESQMSNGRHLRMTKDK